MRKRILRTFDQMHDDCTAKGHPCAYWGEHGTWYVALGQTRDSDSLDRSNFRSLLKLLGRESDTVTIERESHWAVGWVEFILIAPNAREKLKIAVKAKRDLEGYPILDDEDFSKLEDDDFWEFAEGELKQFTDWETVLSTTMEELGTQVGHDASEWGAIKAAREHLEAMEEEAA